MDPNGHGSQVYNSQIERRKVSPAEHMSDDETPCPKRSDEQHCNCWYDGEACCACGSASMREELNSAFIRPTLVGHCDAAFPPSGAGEKE